MSDEEKDTSGNGDPAAPSDEAKERMRDKVMKEAREREKRMKGDKKNGKEDNGDKDN